MKKWSYALGLALIFAMFANFVAGLADDWAFEAANVELQRRGRGDIAMQRVSSQVSRSFFGGAAEVTYLADDRGKPLRIRITLSRPVNFVAWRVTHYEED